MKSETRSCLIVLLIGALIIVGLLSVFEPIGGYKDRPVQWAHIERNDYTIHLFMKAEGEAFWNPTFISVDLIWRDVEIKVDSSAPGTLLTVKDLILYQTPFRADHVIVTVRTEEEKKIWEKAIKEARKKFWRGELGIDIPLRQI